MTVSSGEGELIISEWKEQTVAPKLRKQEHRLPLSNLDLLLPPVDVSVFFCYQNPLSVSFESMVGSLKNALAHALISYYPFAGEVAANSMGEPELLCSNRGVDFVEAIADVELHCLNMYKADDTIEGKLAPKKKHGVLAVQVTCLKCGGLVVACTFDHRIADAYSANMFLVSWAEIAQLNNPVISTQPYFRSSVLTPRQPPFSIHPSLHDMYAPISTLPPPLGFESEALVSRIYYVTGEHVNCMQTLASSNSVKRTRLESFSAFLWKMVAEAAAAASVDGKRNFVAKMGVVVDGRKILDNNGDNNMASYFGNVLSIPFGEKPMGELVEKPLSWVAEKVHELLEMGATEEHFLGLVDWVEAHRPVPGVARIYCGHENEEGPHFVVSSGQRFPVSKVDFGWGRPVFGSYHFPWGGDAGYVMPMPSPVGNGDWLLYMHFSKGSLNFMESKAPHVFKSFSWDYLLK